MSEKEDLNVSYYHIHVGTMKMVFIYFIFFIHLNNSVQFNYNLSSVFSHEEKVT